MSTRWRPDTCLCELEFTNGPEALPTFITRCPEHLESSEAIVVAECAGKNAARSLLLDAGVALVDISTRFTVVGNGKRSLSITVPKGTPPLQADAIVARLAEWRYPSAYADRIAIRPRT